MKLDDSPRSDNVEDQRSPAVGRGAGIGLGTLLIVVIGYFLGVSPQTMWSLLNGGEVPPPVPAGAPHAAAPANDPQVDFVRAVLGDTEAVWGAYFKERGAHYAPPTLVLYSGAVESTCGYASAAAGPFYCPADRKAYLDLTFFRQLAADFGAPGDFARAYVIAHEIGHHVQNLLGITDRAANAEARASRLGANRLSVQIELQADCFAGVWAARADDARQVLEPGDLEQGLRAAAAVGDDTLQRRAQGMVVPDTFTHGSAAQRVGWFRRGFDSGDPQACNTLGAAAAR